MSRIAYVNGRYVRHNEASVSIEDRGYQFADAVYEVWSVFDSRLADLDGHLTRLKRSLDELNISPPMPKSSLLAVLSEVIRRNHIVEGMVYLQISRGVAPRDHFYPIGIKPSLIITAKAIDRKAAEDKALIGIKAISAPDIRWGRCDIKTVGLLPNIMGKQKAKDLGASEVIFVDTRNYVTEGGATNVYMVDSNGLIKTRSLDSNILGGITRKTIFALIKDTELNIVEQAFTLDEAKAASEVFVSAATSIVMPIINIDGTQISNGKPGEVTLALRKAYIENARLQAGCL